MAGKRDKINEKAKGDISPAVGTTVSATTGSMAAGVAADIALHSIPPHSEHGNNPNQDHSEHGNNPQRNPCDPETAIRDQQQAMKQMNRYANMMQTKPKDEPKKDR